jgi:restriction system protein
VAQRGGGRSEWERQQVAARREAERAARERVRAEKEAEKRRKEQHVVSQVRRAQQQSTEAEQRIQQLNGILSAALEREPLSFEDLLTQPKIPTAEPGSLAG